VITVCKVFYAQLFLERFVRTAEIEMALPFCLFLSVIMRNKVILPLKISS
jgi:hypothetical protein